jgi:hypothetical protein
MNGCRVHEEAAAIFAEKSIASWIGLPQNLAGCGKRVTDAIESESLVLVTLLHRQEADRCQGPCAGTTVDRMESARMWRQSNGR